MQHDLYIYYRVKDTNSYQLNQVIVAMQATLAATYQVTTSIKKRLETEKNFHTWMEVYYAVTLDFAEIVAQKVTNYRLSHLIDGPRHIEFFINP
jgi:hypothetical protein